MKKLLFTAMALILAAGLWCPSFGQKGEFREKTGEGIQVDDLVETFFTKRTGDLSEMMKYHRIRVLVVPSRSTYFLDEKGQPRGIDYELLKGWEKMLNRKRRKGVPPVSVIFIPVTLEELGDALLEGRGDIAGITLKTPNRTREFAYATPIFDNIQEVVVTRKGGLSISTLEDLSGLEVHVVSGSAQMEAMEALNQRLEKQSIAPVKTVLAAPYVAQENLLEMIHGGMIRACVVPDAIARLWAKVFKELVIHENIPVTTGLKAAWAVRKENPELLAGLNEAISSVLKKNKRAFERDFNQYFVNTKWIKNPFVKGSKFDLADDFQREAAAFGMDWIQLMAQGFQESTLNNKVRSPYGAVGIMQVLPSTAKWIGVPDYKKAGRNIHAGAKYMARMMKRYEKEAEVSPKDRFLFSLASYNAGPGNMRKYRRRAVKYGYDPNQWFGNVERAALRSGNLESVIYVRNILNYTLAYKSAYEQSLRRGDLKENKAGASAGSKK